MENFIVIVLDGIGIGELPDANNFNDEGSDTLGNMANKLGGLSLPCLEKLGLGNIKPINGIDQIENPLASFGKMLEISCGKDSTTGHWELGGLKVDINFPYYPEGFPEQLIKKFLEKTGLKNILGNYPASGTEIIKELGEEHLKTGFPIVYTSADSVFQIAAHEEIISLERLYEICSIAREEVFMGKNSVGRVIARPFIGSPGNFKRTTNRKDYSLDPPSYTILDYCFNAGIPTYGIGKIVDLFNGKGIKNKLKTKSNLEGMEQIFKTVKEETHSFIFANLVDFDVYYGHRNDPAGFYSALKEFDLLLPIIIGALDKTDHLVITSDHGNDPTDISTDHTREYVPLLYYRKEIPGRDLGIRKTFSDVSKTAADFFKIQSDLMGESFLIN